jgi:hypothetical protein
MSENIRNTESEQSTEKKISAQALSLVKKRKMTALTVFLFFFITLLTGVMMMSLFIIPLVWLCCEVVFYIQKKKAAIRCVYVPFFVFLFRIAGIGALASFCWFLVGTPLWMQKLSHYLERFSLISWFEFGSYMYGRIFICFWIFVILFVLSFFCLRPKKES